MNDRQPPANGSSSLASVDGRWSHLALVLILRLSVCYAADHVTNPLDASHLSFWSFTGGCTSGGVYVPCIFTCMQVRVTVGDLGLGRLCDIF